MYKYILKRILLMIPVLLGVVIFIFLILQASPGDPAKIILGESATPEAIEALRNDLGLNDPLLVQMGRYLKNLLHGDLGSSYMSGAPVLQEISARFPKTLTLATLSVLLMVIIGVPIGIISAVKQYSWLDNGLMSFTLISISMPTFWVGMLFTLLFSLKLGWLPATGWGGPKYWIMPVVTLALAQSAQMARMTRSSMLEVIRQDYIRTARAKGQREKIVVLRHAFKNSLLPIVTVVGIQMGMALGGALVTENVFAIPGIGSFMLAAIQSRDYPVVEGGVIFIALCFSIVNLIVDIVYAYIDPRIMAQYKSKKKKKIVVEKEEQGVKA